MRGSIFQVRQQGTIGSLLLLRQNDRLILKRDAGVKVDGTVDPRTGQHAFGAEIVQHRPADAFFFQFSLRAGASTEQRHCRQLFGGRFRLYGQLPGQLVRILRVAGELFLQYRRHTIGSHGGLVLCPIRDNRLDGLVIGAERPFF